MKYHCQVIVTRSGEPKTFESYGENYSNTSQWVARVLEAQDAAHAEAVHIVLCPIP